MQIYTKRYNEDKSGVPIFIKQETSFDSDLLGLHEHWGKYKSINEANYLAAQFSNIGQNDS